MVASDDVIRPIVPVRLVAKNGRERVIHAMLDSGANCDCVTGDLVGDMRIEKREVMIDIQTVASQSRRKNFLASFTIESLDGNTVIPIENALVAGRFSGGEELPPSQRDWSQFEHLNGVEFVEARGGIEVIIGVAHASSWVTGEIRSGGPRDPIGLKTDFGWTVLGCGGQGPNPYLSINSTSISNTQLHDAFMKIFYHDHPCVSEEEMGPSVENQDAIRQLAESIRFDESLKKYVVALPWKFGREKAMETLNSLNSRSMAMRRLTGLISRFRREPERRKKVFGLMDKFVNTGVTEEIDPTNDDASATRPRWYVPIHVAEKRGKLRACHDARASVNGVCLNDHLLGGPNLINSLSEVLLNFRKWKVAFMTDIKAFFHQVRIDERDLDVFRYFWFADESMQQAVLYRFLSHVFGSGASSVVTCYVLRHHAETIKHLFPDNVYQMIRHAFYVDDGSGGANDVQSALELKENVKKALDLGGFSLGKWQSNAKEITDGEKDDVVKIGEGLEDEGTAKALGVTWRTKADTLSFVIDKEIVEREVTTPRGLVAVQSSVWDPDGMVVPVVLPGRKLLQVAKTPNMGWDSPLDPQVKKDFDKWKASLPLLADLEVPRWWNDGIEEEDILIEELHLFADAAQGGYGAGGYRRIVTKDGRTRVVLLKAVAHATPLDASKASHHNSIPRLEVAAAEKAVELRLWLERALKRKFKRVILWSDSEAALKMIFDRTSKFKAYFANRLSKIHAGSDVREWRYVNSEDNPADYNSRGIQAHEKEKWKIFHRGPKFLYQPENEWPKTNIASFPDNSPLYSSCAIRQEVAGGEAGKIYPYAEIAERCNDWPKKIRRIALFRRLISTWKLLGKAKTRAQKAAVPKVYEISDTDREEAELALIRSIQLAAFGEEIKELKNTQEDEILIGRKKPKKSRLGRHHPFIDLKGVMRIGSRLENANVEREEKYPAILPKNDENVKALIRFTHRRLKHGGQKITLCEIRTKYWILQGMQAVKSVVTKCVSCQKRFKRPMNQLMAPLPEERVSMAAPFENTGVDLMGPFLVKENGRADHKKWVAIFTCLSTRSVHAEIVHKIDACSMINAIVRFASRRPGVKKFISDNGTNFSSAAKILKKEMEKWVASSAENLHEKGLAWEFIPVGTPHYGGVWERMVGLFKRHLAAVSTGDVLHIDTFATILCEIEDVINKRPLTEMSSNSADPEAITPRHILYPATFAHSSAIIIPAGVGNNAAHVGKSYERAQNRVDAFWRVWSKEYLQLLHNRQKWQTVEKNIKPGDIVIIVDETKSRNKWALARVVSVENEGKHARKFSVQRKDGTCVDKDRTKLVLLELDD